MIIPAIKNRRSVRQFKTNPVPEDMVLELLKAAQFAPTSRGNKAMHYLVVTDQRIKQQIHNAAQPVQDFVSQAPLLIIMATDPNQTNQPVQDLSLASENIMLQATELSLGSVWKNFKPAIAEEVKKILKIPGNCLITNAIAVGYPAESVEPHLDRDFDKNRLHFQTW